METVPVIILGQEPDWLEKQFAAVVSEIERDHGFVFVQRCPKGAGTCVVVTDDLSNPRLRDLLFECVERIRGEQIVALAWDSPRNAVALLRIPLMRLYFPAEDTGTATDAVRALGLRLPPPQLGSELDPTLPPSLAVGLRKVFRRCGDPFGPPPPRKVVHLARLVPCQPATLYRSASLVGLDLAGVLRLACVRWLRLALSSPEANRESLAHALGYETTRGLYRFVKTEAGVPFPELLRLEIDSIDVRLRTILRTGSRRKGG